MLSAITLAATQPFSEIVLKADDQLVKFFAMESKGLPPQITPSGSL